MKKWLVCLLFTVGCGSSNDGAPSDHDDDVATDEMVTTDDDQPSDDDTPTDNEPLPTYATLRLMAVDEATPLQLCVDGASVATAQGSASAFVQVVVGVHGVEAVASSAACGAGQNFNFTAKAYSYVVRADDQRLIVHDAPASGAVHLNLVSFDSPPITVVQPFPFEVLYNALVGSAQLDLARWTGEILTVNDVTYKNILTSAIGDTVTLTFTAGEIFACDDHGVCARKTPLAALQAWVRFANFAAAGSVNFCMRPSGSFSAADAPVHEGAAHSVSGFRALQAGSYLVRAAFADGTCDAAGTSLTPDPIVIDAGSYVTLVAGPTVVGVAVTVPRGTTDDATDLKLYHANGNAGTLFLRATSLLGWLLGQFGTNAAADGLQPIRTFFAESLVDTTLTFGLGSGAIRETTATIPVTQRGSLTVFIEGEAGIFTGFAVCENDGRIDGAGDSVCTSSAWSTIPNDSAMRAVNLSSTAVAAAGGPIDVCVTTSGGGQLKIAAGLGLGEVSSLTPVDTTQVTAVYTVPATTGSCAPASAIGSADTVTSGVRYSTVVVVGEGVDDDASTVQTVVSNAGNSPFATNGASRWNLVNGWDGASGWTSEIDDSGTEVALPAYGTPRGTFTNLSYPTLPTQVTLGNGTVFYDYPAPPLLPYVSYTAYVYGSASAAPLMMWCPENLLVSGAPECVTVTGVAR